MIQKKSKSLPCIARPCHFATAPQSKAQHHGHGVVADEHGKEDGVHDHVGGGKGHDALVDQAVFMSAVLCLSASRSSASTLESSRDAGGDSPQTGAREGGADHVKDRPVRVDRCLLYAILRLVWGKVTSDGEVYGTGHER